MPCTEGGHAVAAGQGGKVGGWADACDCACVASCCTFIYRLLFVLAASLPLFCLRLPMHLRRVRAAALADPSLTPHADVPRHQAYLQGVVEAGYSFQEIEDVLARHATLRAANADLQAAQAAAAAEAEEVRAATAALVRARSAEVLDLNNQLAALKKEAEVAAAEAAALEAGREYTLRAAAARALEVGQVEAAAANLYQRVLQRSRVARPHDEATPLAQLEAVTHYLGDLCAALAAHPGEAVAAAAAQPVAGG